MSHINVCLVKEGKPINIQATDDMMFAELAFKYFQKYGIDQFKDQPKFFYNSMEIPSTSQRSLKEIGILNNTRIEVVIGKDVIGAKI